jgi:hypothetical protein
MRFISKEHALKISLAEHNRDSRDWFEEHGMRRMPRPHYLPDFTPIDFCLFPTVKKLERIYVADEDEFFGSLQEILRGID